MSAETKTKAKAEAKFVLIAAIHNGSWPLDDRKVKVKKTQALIVTAMKFFRILLSIQCIYTFITAVWPLIDIESFMLVTGYKTDLWLVKTVGAILVSVSLCMATHLFIRTDHIPVVVLAITSSIAFICIDFYYALNDTISDIYMADGALQILFLTGWIGVIVTALRNIRSDR